jgi:pimeloyl-ACP methyl ester carboxylesterase
MEKIKIANRSLAYERRGRGAPLVLIHGFPLDHSIWDEVTPLLENDFDLILPDLRGFGGSDSTSEMYTMTDLADDIASLLDHLGIESTLLAGHSMGGYVALAFAQGHASRVRGLALVSSMASADAPERKAGRYAQAAQIAENGIGETVAGMTSKLSADERVQKFIHDLMKRQKPAGYVGSLKAMAERRDTLSVLTAASFPVALVHGDADALIPIAKAQEIQSAVQRAKMFALEGIGHMPMMETPPAVADALKSLI